jgi:DNA-binding FadR family transcriptional regulator
LALPGRLGTSINEHRVLMHAIEQGDAVRAERAMHDHLMAQLAALKALQRAERESTSLAPQARRRARPAHGR